MLKKILTVYLIAFNYINATSTLFTIATEEAEIIHCRKAVNSQSIITIFRQQQSVQVINDCLRELDFVKPITEEAMSSLLLKLKKAGFDVAVSLLTLAKNTSCKITKDGWLNG